MRARVLGLVCMLLAGCGHDEPRLPYRWCATYYRERVGRSVPEYYRLNGEEVSSSELRARMLADPESHARTAVSRRLWSAGWGVLGADLAATAAGFVLAVSSKATQTPGIGLAIGGAVNIGPILGGFFGASRYFFHRAMEDYNHDAGVHNACPP